MESQINSFSKTDQIACSKSCFKLLSLLMSRNSCRLAQSTADNLSVADIYHSSVLPEHVVYEEVNAAGEKRVLIEFLSDDEEESEARKRVKGSSIVESVPQGCHCPKEPPIDLTGESDSSVHLENSSSSFEIVSDEENPDAAVSFPGNGAQISDEGWTEDELVESEGEDSDDEVAEVFPIFDPDLMHLEAPGELIQQPPGSSLCFPVSMMNCLWSWQDALRFIGCIWDFTPRSLTIDDFHHFFEWMEELDIDINVNGMGPADARIYLVAFQVPLLIFAWKLKVKARITLADFFLPDLSKSGLTYVITGKQTTDKQLQQRSLNKLIGRRVVGRNSMDIIAPEADFRHHETLDEARKLFRDWKERGMEDSFGCNKSDYSPHAICIKFNAAGIPFLYDPGKVDNCWFINSLIQVIGKKVAKSLYNKYGRLDTFADYHNTLSILIKSLFVIDKICIFQARFHPLLFVN